MAVGAISRRPKLAQRLAESLAVDIHESRMPVGARLGNEDELATRLGASRWTVRQALQILEREGHIAIRRGRYGGVFVAAADMATLCSSIRHYLQFIRVEVGEIIEAHRVLEEAILERAIERLRPAEVAPLREGTARLDSMRGAARSPVLEAFVRAVSDLGQSIVLRSALDETRLSMYSARIQRLRAAQIEAVIAGRRRDALCLENDVLEATAQLLESARQSPGTAGGSVRSPFCHFSPGDRRVKRPELLMQEIGAEIVARGWPAGGHLGTEPELLAKYAVSRSTFREAVRSLEQLGVVEMRTGRHCGLHISSPDPQSVACSCRRLMARIGVNADQVVEAFMAVGVAAAGFAAERHGKITGCATSPPRPEGHFFTLLGEASGNRVLALLIRILCMPPISSSAQHADAAASASLARIDAAIAVNDAALARREFLCLKSRFVETIRDGRV